MNFEKGFVAYNLAGLEEIIVPESREDVDFETVNYIRRTRNDISVLLSEEAGGIVTGRQISAWQLIANSGSDSYTIAHVMNSLDDVQRILLFENAPPNQL